MFNAVMKIKQGLRPNYILISLVITAIYFIFVSIDLLSAETYFLFGITLAVLFAIAEIDDPVLRKLLFTALSLRLIMAVIQAYTPVDLSEFNSGSDARKFENYAWQNAQAWLSGEQGVRLSGAYLYSFWVGIIYFIFGRIPFVALFSNVLFGTAAVYLVYAITVEAFNRRSAWISALITAIFPSFLLYSAVMLRESMIIFFILLSLLYFVRWLYRVNLVYILYSLASSVIAGIMHSAFFFINWVYIFYISFYNPEEDKFRLLNKKILVGLVLVVGAMLLINDVITYQVPEDLSRALTPEFLGSVVRRKALGRTTYLHGLVPESYFDLIWQTPLRMLYFFLAPFPWMIGNIGDLIVFGEALFYLGLVYFGIKGISLLNRKQLYLKVALLLIVLSLVFMFAWGTTNYGTAWRHRVKIAPYLIVMASSGLTSCKYLRWLFPEEST